ncbi:MAG: excisionase family DNA-binding protein [Nitrospira sp.]|nr:excisionase family DNA-binding protein [Nitrospira sp.]
MYDTTQLLQKAKLRIDEAAAVLDVHQNTVRRWVDEGKLDGIRTAGGHRRVRTESVLKYL